jgi:hypothetical protein
VSFVLSLLLALAGDRIPSGSVPVAKLTTASLRHIEVMRIDRDFGMAKWELALDGWMPQDGEAQIADLRLWWVNVEEDDRRKPMNAHLKRYIDFGFERVADGSLVVHLAGDGKRYEFEVALDPAGVPGVLVSVTLADGVVVTRCRCERGRLLARRLLGIPIGIASLQMRCVDPSGQAHDGTVPYRAIEAGKAYQPE